MCATRLYATAPSTRAKRLVTHALKAGTSLCYILRTPRQQRTSHAVVRTPLSTQKSATGLVSTIFSTRVPCKGVIAVRAAVLRANTRCTRYTCFYHEVQPATTETLGTTLLSWSMSLCTVASTPNGYLCSSCTTHGSQPSSQVAHDLFPRECRSLFRREPLKERRV